MARRRSTQLTINHERWLVSYADFITLLFAFFVVMYSVSQVSESKYRVLSDTLESTFNYPAKNLKPIQVGEPSRASDPSVIDSGQAPDHEQIGDGAFEQEVDLPHMAENLRESLADLIDQQQVQINSNEFWLEIELKSNMLFDTASAKPSADAKLIFTEIAKQLLAGQHPIQVEGYTDSNPINTAVFPSNWELSAARASAVVKLLDAAGIAPQRLSAIGYGEYQPLADNSTEAGRAQNRRVVLMVARDRQNRPTRTAADIAKGAFREGVFETLLQPAATSSAAVENTGPGPDILIDPDSSPAAVVEGSRNGLRVIKLESGGLLFTSEPEPTKDEQ